MPLKLPRIRNEVCFADSISKFYHFSFTNIQMACSLVLQYYHKQDGRIYKMGQILSDGAFLFSSSCLFTKFFNRSKRYHESQNAPSEITLPMVVITTIILPHCRIQTFFTKSYNLEGIILHTSLLHGYDAFRSGM